MVGNVFELVNEVATPSENAKTYFASMLRPAPAPDEPWYTIRGQSFFKDEKLDARVLYDSTTVPARWKNPNIGFRCVKDPGR
jgi:hypothetical protein